MRSLSSKLVLGFLITSLVGAVLASIFVRQFVSTQFDAFVINQQREFFIDRVRDYYATNGSLNNISKWLGERNNKQRWDNPPGSMPPPDEPPAIGFGLTDATGVVLIPVGNYIAGETVPAAELSAGTPITNDDQTIGVALTLNSGAIRDPAQERYLASTDAALSIAAAATAGIAVALGFLLARLITQPLRELT
ncbi:MAG: hypothetical protein HGA19_05770, partial [Oscillochloris sp.]|nr:hypothetical protein [Oscillochloris sp.]